MQILNTSKRMICQNLIVKKIQELRTKEINQKLEKEKVDVTLPCRPFVKEKFILSPK